MRPFERLVIGCLVVAVVFVSAFWYLDRRPGSMTRMQALGLPGGLLGIDEPVAAAAEPEGTEAAATVGLPLPLTSRPTRIVWAGDSLAGSLAAAVTAQGAVRGVEIVGRTTPGCGMVRGLPTDAAMSPVPWAAACDESVGPHVASVSALGADVVTWLSTWETANRIVDGQGYEFGTPEADAMLLALIDESARQLTAGGARLVLLTVAPNTTAPGRPERDPAAEQRARHLNALLRRYAAAHPDRVAVLDLAAMVCPTGPPCPAQVDGHTLRPEDGAHFAGSGPAWVAQRVFDHLLGPA
ncbi:MAG: hypothetical protein FJW95_11060 [Actinobacteria bacterium]|nr:hypothetical protein [Actinomycetota bacterium]